MLSTPERPVVRVLVVEDDPDTCQAVVEALTEAGYATTSTLSAAAAIADLGGTDAPPDVIVLDLAIPVSSGIDFLAWQAAAPSPCTSCVVVLSAHDGLRAQAMAFATSSVLSKPVRLVDLLAAVGHASRRGLPAT